MYQLYETMKYLCWIVFLQSVPAPRRFLHLAPPFLVENHEPVALKTFREGKMKQKVEEAKRELEDCRACPRNCGVDRMKDKKGS